MVKLVVEKKDGVDKEQDRRPTPAEGIEPSTLRLKASRSTAELSGHAAAAVKIIYNNIFFSIFES